MRIIVAVTGADCGRNPARDLLWQDPFGQSDYEQGRVDSRCQLIKEVTDSDRPAAGETVFGSVPCDFEAPCKAFGMERGLKKAR